MRWPPLSPTALMRWAIVEPLVDALAPQRILEIGCGLGGFGSRLASRYSYVGLEQDRQSFLVAERRIGRVGGTVLHGTPDDLDPDDTFDLVCAFEVIEHIRDDVAALRGWVSRLDAGGSVMLSVPAWPARYGPGDERVGHYRRYAPADMDALLADAGCRRVRHLLYGWPLGYLLEYLRNGLAARHPDALGDSLSARTARSGRTLQPGWLAGPAVRVGTMPFVAMQRWRPGEGTGLVGVGTV